MLGLSTTAHILAHAKQIHQNQRYRASTHKTAQHAAKQRACQPLAGPWRAIRA